MKISFTITNSDYSQGCYIKYDLSNQKNEGQKWCYATDARMRLKECNINWLKNKNLTELGSKGLRAIPEFNKNLTS